MRHPGGAPGISRRALVKGGLAAVGGLWAASCARPDLAHATFVGRVADYSADIVGVLLDGFRALGVGEAELAGRRILLKPNLVETHVGSRQINTDPLFVRAAIEAFLHLGAAEVWVGEGPGHRRDTRLVLVESGLGEVLEEDAIRFVDLNYDGAVAAPNAGHQTRMANLLFPQTLRQVDWVVSLPKMKTHHWTGVTLSLKNLFGVMPGLYYGWPKNVLHWAGIESSILDIYATLRPHFAIVDGIIGMEGDGPIMGTPRAAGVVVMGRDLVAVDATACRVMRIDPAKVSYLQRAGGWLGPIGEAEILQVGERPEAVATRFQLLPGIPAHRGISL